MEFHLKKDNNLYRNVCLLFSKNIIYTSKIERISNRIFKESIIFKEPIKYHSLNQTFLPVHRFHSYRLSHSVIEKKYKKNI